MSDVVTIALIAAVPGVISSILAYLTHEKVEVVRKDVNSKMAELVKTTGEAEHAKGNLEGRAELKEEQKS